MDNPVANPDQMKDYTNLLENQPNRDVNSEPQFEYNSWIQKNKEYKAV